MLGRPVYIYSALRTPRALAKDRGGLRNTKPIDLVAALLAAMQQQTHGALDSVEDLVLGCVTQVGEQGANLARTAALYAGLPSCSGVTINRFCASGLDAIALAASKVASGMEDLVLAGGVESMSRVPMLSDGGPWFADADVAARTRFIHMGVAADLIATRRGYSRETVDEFALTSHKRASRARACGFFARSIVPIAIAEGRLCEHDEGIREGLTRDKLAKLPAAFVNEGARGADAIALARYPDLARIDHVHAAGSAPQMVDGASLLLLGSAEAGERAGLRPRARVRSFANATTDPVEMLTAPAPATRRALARAGLTLPQVGRFECNESFSATVLAYRDELVIDPARLNPRGGAIALGHPLGATGGVLVATLLDELEACDETIGVVAMCAGAGIGAALVVERM